MRRNRDIVSRTVEVAGPQQYSQADRQEKKQSK